MQYKLKVAFKEGVKEVVAKRLKGASHNFLVIENEGSKRPHFLVPIRGEDYDPEWAVQAHKERGATHFAL